VYLFVFGGLGAPDFPWAGAAALGYGRRQFVKAQRHGLAQIHGRILPVSRMRCAFTNWRAIQSRAAAQGKSGAPRRRKTTDHAKLLEVLRHSGYINR